MSIHAQTPSDYIKTFAISDGKSKEWIKAVIGSVSLQNHPEKHFSLIPPGSQEVLGPVNISGALD